MAQKTKFEMAIVANVIAMREKKGYSQGDIAKVLNHTKGFIGQIESPNNPSKYNSNHLNKLAYEFGCSPRDFIPAKPIKEEDWE